MGVSEHPDGWNDSYQFIFSDTSRTQSKEDKLKDKSLWKDKLIPLHAQIGQVQVMFEKANSKLMGIKFCDRKGVELLKTKRMDSQIYANKKGFPVRTVSLRENERLVGVYSQ